LKDGLGSRGCFDNGAQSPTKSRGKWGRVQERLGMV
jgi:hypothetical protein